MSCWNVTKCHFKYHSLPQRCVRSWSPWHFPWFLSWLSSTLRRRWILDAISGVIWFKHVWNDSILLHSDFSIQVLHFQMILEWLKSDTFKGVERVDFGEGDEGPGEFEDAWRQKLRHHQSLSSFGFCTCCTRCFEGSHRKEDSDGSESVDGVKTNHPQSSKLDFRSSQAHGSLPMASSLLLYVQFSPLWPHSMQLASDHIRSCNFLERAEGWHVYRYICNHM